MGIEAITKTAPALNKGVFHVGVARESQGVSPKIFRRVCKVCIHSSTDFKRINGYRLRIRLSDSLSVEDEAYFLLHAANRQAADDPALR